MQHLWLYLLMVVAGTILFYFGNEAPQYWQNEWLNRMYTFCWTFGGFLFIVGITNASHACETELKYRHKEEV